MTNEDIIRMAREAGFLPDMFGIGIWDSKELNVFAALVAAAERERILDMCGEGLWDGAGIRFHLEKKDRHES
jgi:hypothetical protein